MEKLIAIVLETDSNALASLETLRELDRIGEISLYEAKVVRRQPDGSLKVIDHVELPEFNKALGGTLLGIVVGILGGPVGMMLGGSAGLLLGTFSEVVAQGVTVEFIQDIESALIPGKTVVLASISEDSTEVLDIAVEKLGGVIFRRIRIYEKERQEDLDAVAHQAEMEQLSAERARAHADRKAKLDAKIDHLRLTFEKAIERKRLNMRKREQERDAKVAALQAKANHSKIEIGRRHLARISELQHDYSEEAARTSV